MAAQSTAADELLDVVRLGESTIVYRAIDTWDRYPDVVQQLKILRPELGGELAPALALRREIDVLARCNHPKLVHLRQAGIVGKLLYYVAEELPESSAR